MRGSIFTAICLCYELTLVNNKYWNITFSKSKCVLPEKEHHPKTIKGKGQEVVANKLPSLTENI